MKSTYGRLSHGTSLRELWHRLSPRNRVLIEEWLTYKKGSVCDQRLEKLSNSLVKFADLLELDFDRATKQDITRAWNIILASPLAVKTKQDEYLHIRQGFKHWFGNDEEFPAVVRGMKRPSGRGRLRLPEEMPDEEVLHRAIKLCPHPRDKFFLAYQGLDAGARPIELRRLQWKNLKKDPHGYFFRIYTAKKSGAVDYRPIRVIFSEPYLLDWMKGYPGQRHDDNYVFCAKDDPTMPIRKDTITKLFKRLKHKLGWKNKFSAYVLRHATLTRMGKNPQVSEAVLKKFAGHTQSSTIIGEYQHYGGDDIKEMQLNYAGQTRPAEDKSYELQKKPQTCPHCRKSNPWDAEVCGFCNFALSQQRQIAAADFNHYKEKIDDLEKSNQQLTQLSLKLTRKVESFLRDHSAVTSKRPHRQRKEHR